MLELAFWLCAAIILAAYLLYPVFLAGLAWLRPRPVKRGLDGPRTVSFVVCANNEQKNIERRLLELIGILEATGITGEIIVVSDGSTDDTAALARMSAKQSVRVLELHAPVGKAGALSQGVALARNAIVVFADVRQAWAPDALELLLENFADPAVGAVSGDLVVVSGPGVLAGVSVYWRFEKWLRQRESLVWSMVGVTGAISAVRRELFQPIPAGTLLDDVYWPLCVAMSGYRVVHDSRALAYDRLPDRTCDEFRRKVRTLAGNFQLIARVPRSLLPWANPIQVQLLGHKLLRLAVPWALLGLLGCNLALDGEFYLAALIAQGGCYALGVTGLLTRRGGRLTSIPASFLVLNAAAAVALLVWVTGRSGRSWRKVSYEKSNPPGPAPVPTTSAVM